MRLFYILYLLFFCFSNQAFAQFTSIPDIAFEQKLIQLGIDSDAIVNGQMLTADAVGITSLDLSNSNISNLTGIAAFLNLTKLDCQNNKLSSLGISSNTALTYLDCSSNSNLQQLTVLGISSNINLDTLICQGVYLNSLDVSNQSNLRYLKCKQNSISSLDISNNPNLEYLDCVVNQLDSLDISNNLILEFLSCGFNQIDSLNISNNLNLLVLLAGGNPISQIDPSNNINLIELAIGNAQLTSLDLSNNVNLLFLACNSNPLDSIDLSNNPLLELLDCSSSQLSELDISNNPNLEWLFCSGNQLTELDLSIHDNLVYLSCENNLLSTLDLSAKPFIQGLYCHNNLLNYINLKNGANTIMWAVYATNNTDSLLICVDNPSYSINSSVWTVDSTTNYTDLCRGTTLFGLITHDLNFNCLIDSASPLLPNHIVRIANNIDTFYATSNIDGRYSSELDTGTYTLDIITNSPYWISCPLSQSTTTDSSYSIDTVNWSMQAIIQCPYLVVGISAPFLRMTGGSYYVISYCNNGTAAEPNPYVVVSLDHYLNVTGTSIPATSQNGNFFTFNLDTLDVGECGSFTIDVLVDTTAILGQTHCSKVNIFPDTLCVPIWTGPAIEASSECQNDTVFFKLKNNGTNMLAARNYSIFEDDVILRIDSFNIGGGDSILITQPAALGSSYRIEAYQALGFPATLGAFIAHASIEGCNPFSNGSFNTGFITQYYTGNSSPFAAVDCQQNIAAYDPNDKAAKIEGYDNPHYIYANIPLEYRVRFQNTGNDTAFNIVVVDTISPYLDITSLQMGPSSHAYTWALSGENVLTVTFSDIKLVDSIANEPLSHGFFSYTIHQKNDLPIGTVINNQAAIYFDYNPPIFTNTTFHTIGENFVVTYVAIDKIFEKQIVVTALPNPFTHETTFKVEGKEYLELQLSVYDVTGRKVAQETSYSNNQIQLPRGNMQAGIYFYQIMGDDKLINVGKIIVQ